TVVENSVAHADGGLATVERIPRQAKARLEIKRIVVIKFLTRAGSDSRKRKRRRTGRICEEVRELAVPLEGHAIELIAEAQLQSEVRPKLPLVLKKRSIL